MRTWDDYKKTFAAADNIWLAAKEENIEKLTSFLENGVDVNSKDSRGYSPLMLAAYKGSEKTVAFLLERGADANSADAAQNSILMGCAFKGHLEICKILISAGAFISLKNQSGMDAYDFAVTFGRKDVADYFLSQGARPRSNHRFKNFIKIVWQRIEKLRS